MFVLYIIIFGDVPLELIPFVKNFKTIVLQHTWKKGVEG